MKLRRAPLFIFGLLYGAVVNSVVLGLGYGVYAAGVTIGGICEVFCGRGGGGTCLAGSGDAVCFMLGVLGVITLAGAAVGFAIGVLYGLVTGSWHCAMDFYNNGFKQGLSSPFRFLAAKWSKDMENNPAELAAYYASTDINFFDKKPVVKERICDRVRVVDALINKAVKEKVKDTKGVACSIPFDISKHIASFESVGDIQLYDPSTSRVATRIERSVLGEEHRRETKGTIGIFFSQKEIEGIIRTCPQRKQETVSYQPDVLVPEELPLIKDTLRRMRSAR